MYTIVSGQSGGAMSGGNVRQNTPTPQPINITPGGQQPPRMPGQQSFTGQQTPGMQTSISQVKLRFI